MFKTFESRGKDAKHVSRGNLYSFVAPPPAAFDEKDVAPPFTKHTFRPSLLGVKKISLSVPMDKDKYMARVGPEEAEDYYISAESAFPAERKYGGGNAKVLMDYDEELRRRRAEQKRSPPKKKKEKIKFVARTEAAGETAEEREKRLLREEADKLLNSGVSYLKMKQMKERGNKGQHLTLQEEIVKGGAARAVESHHNREIFRDIVQSNFRGEDLTSTLTKKLDMTLELKERQLELAMEENLDLGNRGEFVSQQRKAYVQKRLQTDIDGMNARKDKITAFVAQKLVQGRTAVLFGDDDEESVLSSAEPFSPSASVASASSKKRTDPGNVPPLLPEISREEAFRRTKTPNAAMKRESVRRGVIPFSIKELVSSAVRMEEQLAAQGKRREERKKQQKKALAEMTDEMRSMQEEDTMLTLFPEDDESVGYNTENDIVSINVADYGLGDAKAACLAEAIKLCPSITYLNIQGNRLTDDACEPILKAVLQVGTVKTLVLSNNKLDAKSIDPLRENIARVACKPIVKKLNAADGTYYSYEIKEKLDRRPSEDLGLHEYDDAELFYPEEADLDDVFGCAIEDLRLCQSDVDDDECTEFMKALHVNKSLKKLDLSHNLIGDREEEALVFPSFCTGGKAIASMLSVNSTLLDLNLSWNKIRKNSALILVKCLALNKTLTSLNLSSNNIGDYAAQHLANSLRKNTSMVKLDISYNGIMPKGTLVMSHALEENQALLDVSFEGNCIGEAGGKALLRAMRQAAEKKRQLRINFNNCNLHWEDPSLFNRHEPKQGQYSLHLDDPYDYMVGRVLFEIYNNSFGAKFIDVKHKMLIIKPDPTDVEFGLALPVVSGAKAGSWEKIDLKRPDATGNFNAAWDVHLIAISEVCDKWKTIVDKKQTEATYAISLFYKLNRKLVTAIITMGFQLGLNIPVLVAECIGKILFNTSPEGRSKIHMIFKIMFRVVFRVVDEDQSNSVDEEELSKSLSLLGVPFANDEFLCLDYARRMIAGVDVDGDKSLDEGEFVRMMLVSYTETIPQSPQPIVDSTGQPWVMPTTGDMQFVFRCEKLPPSLDELQSDDTVAAFSSSLTKMEGSDENKEANLAMTVTGDTFFSCEQAEMLLLAFPRQKGGTQNSQVIEMFLPQMTTTVEACKFLAQNMNINQIFDLRRRWGAYFSAITGLATGHYFLDMNLEKDRKAARRLAMLNSLQKNKAQVESTTCDTSQNANYENYRNGCMNFAPFDCTSYFFAELPLAGKVSFDFVSITRPVPGVEASSTDSVNSMIERVFHPDLEKYNVAPEFKLELDAEFAAKLQAEREAEEAAREAAAAEEERLRLEKLAEKALAAGMSPPKKVFKRKMSLAMQASAEIVKAEMAENELFATRAAVDAKKAPEKPKYVTLQETTAMKKNEECMQIWNSFVDTSYYKFKKAYRNDLNEKLTMARIDEGLSTSPLNNPEEEEEVRKQAMQNKIYKDYRMVPIHRANLALYLKREKQRIAMQLREAEKAQKKGKGGRGGKNSTDTNEAAIVADEFEKRKKLLRRCLSFEHNLNMLEAYLVYNMYITAEQANAVVQVFIERRAPVEVVIRCICILFARIVDLENLESDLFQNLQLAPPSLESLLDPPPKANKKKVEMIPLSEAKQSLVDEKERLRLIQLVRREVYHRLGMLNVWCPLCPDGFYELDMAAKDHNEALKILLRLAVIEPGPHIIGMAYARSLLEPCKLDKTGRWAPPATWMDGINILVPGATASTGLPKFGEVAFKYASVDEPAPEVDEEEDGEETEGGDEESNTGDLPRPGGKATLGPTLEEGNEEDDEHSAKAKKSANSKKVSLVTAAVPAKAIPKSEAIVQKSNLSGDESDSHAEGETSEVEYRMNNDARRELTRLKTLAGVQGTFIHGWIDGQTKEGIGNVMPELVKPTRSKAQKGFSFVAEEDIIQDNVGYILDAKEAERTFHDDVNTAGGAANAAAGEAKNPHLSMVMTQAHSQEI